MSDNTLVAIAIIALVVALCVMCICGAVASRRPEPRPRSVQIDPPMWTYSRRPAKDENDE